MTEEEYFRKNYPDFCYGDKPLSPHFDFFQAGVEFCERESEKQIEELEAQLEREKNLNQCMTDNNEQLREQIEKMKSDVMGNIKWADQNKNNQMYYKLNAMINQWEIKEK